MNVSSLFGVFDHDVAGLRGRTAPRNAARNRLALCCGTRSGVSDGERGLRVGVGAGPDLV